MSEHNSKISNEPTVVPDIKDVVRHVLEDYGRMEQTKAEPAYKAELHEERKRREQLEGRLNQLVEENRRTRAAAEEVDRHSQIRSELQRLGVAKVDLAFRAVKDDIIRGEDGRLQKLGDGKAMAEYLTDFVQQNPELLPARIAGGSGVQSTSKNASTQIPHGIDMDKIKPGMNPEELDRVRQEIARLALQSSRGL